MQPERRATARAWRTSADQDLRIARGLSDADANVACFHAQQAGEKALKSACVAALDDVARIHVLTSLLDELREGGFSADEEVAAAARTLDRFYAPTRYPDAVGDVDPARLFGAADARAAIADAQTIIRFADDVIAKAFDRVTGAAVSSEAAEAFQPAQTAEAPDAPGAARTPQAPEAPEAPEHE